MAKTKQRVTQKKETETGLSKFSLSNIIPVKYHPLAAILVTVVLYFIFFFPMYFGGKTFQSGDILTSQAMVPYIVNHTDGFTLWNPLIFCGMPAYALGTSLLWFNMIYLIFGSIGRAFGSLFSVEYARWSIYLIVLSLSTFFLVKHLTKNIWIALLAGVAAGFSTGIIVFLYIGHVTKLTSLCFYPLLLLLLIRFQEKIRLIDFLFLVIVLQLFIQGFHVQIIFYILFTIGIYFIYYLLRFIIKKDNTGIKNLLKTMGVFAGAAIIAILIQSDNLTQVYEYTQFSTRGAKGVVENSSTAQEEQGSSDYYEYHTNWSFSPGEVLTFIVPSYYGFGTSKYNGPLTNNQEVEVNTYFGQMPFVDVAMYMGVIVFFLGLFAIFTRWKEPFVRFLTVTTVIALLVSFGKTFPVLFDFMFYYFPTFDKFRVPSMFLVIVQLNFPILAALGLARMLTIKEENNQKLKNAIKYLSFAFTGLFVLFILLNSALTSWFVERVNEYAATLQAARPQMAQQYQALAEYSAGMFTGDLVLAFGMLAAVCWAAFMYINNKFSRDFFVISVIVLIIFDLWRIDMRGAKYTNAPEQKGLFDTPNYVNVIKQQNDKEPFRIINLKQDGSLGSMNSNSNYNAYFMLEDFYGYSGIKPRTYQDIIDVVGPVNQSIWRMANVKYIITDRPAQMPGFEPLYQSEKEFVYRNGNALPRIYFVNRVELKNNIDMLNEFKSERIDPKQVAYVEKPLTVDTPDSTATVKFTSYGTEKIELDVKATGNNFLFFGDTYLSGDVKYAFITLPTGWKATVDGNTTEIYKTNHGFMGIVVPKGQHKVQFEYAPPSWIISKYIVLILSSVSVLGVIVLLIMSRKKKVDLL